MSEAADVRPIVEEDVQPLASMLARAFEADPLARWFVKGDRRRAQRLHRLFTWHLREALPLGHSHTTPERSAAALWMGPGQWKLSLGRQLLLLPEILRVAGPLRALTRIHGVDGVQAQHPAVAHYYLAVLGTEPGLQGRGLGSAVLAWGLRRCDREGVPAYLETATERTVELYRRHGFRVTGEVVARHGGPRVWLLWREPATGVPP